jgi:hypothetical protein
MYPLWKWNVAVLSGSAEYAAKPLSVRGRSFDVFNLAQLERYRDTGTVQPSVALGRNRLGRERGTEPFTTSRGRMAYALSDFDELHVHHDQRFCSPEHNGHWVQPETLLQQNRELSGASDAIAV